MTTLRALHPPGWEIKQRVSKGLKTKGGLYQTHAFGLMVASPMMRYERPGRNPEERSRSMDCGR